MKSVRAIPEFFACFTATKLMYYNGLHTDYFPGFLMSVKLNSVSRYFIIILIFTALYSFSNEIRYQCNEYGRNSFKCVLVIHVLDFTFSVSYRIIKHA